MTNNKTENNQNNEKKIDLENLFWNTANIRQNNTFSTTNNQNNTKGIFIDINNNNNNKLINNTNNTNDNPNNNTIINTSANNNTININNTQQKTSLINLFSNGVLSTQQMKKSNKQIVIIIQIKIYLIIILNWVFFQNMNIQNKSQTQNTTLDNNKSGFGVHQRLGQFNNNSNNNQNNNNKPINYSFNINQGNQGNSNSPFINIRNLRNTGGEFIFGNNNNNKNNNGNNKDDTFF